MEAVIHTQQLSRMFGKQQALDGLNMQLAAGSIFGLLGPNGAGKTTTIRLLLGLVPPSSGQASVLGYDIRTSARQIRARIGVQLEHSGLYERLSASANLEFAGRAYGLTRPVRAARARELLEIFGLWERRDDPVSTWSRGMRQKLAIARALLHRPPLVFLDEPTAGLDPAAAVALRQTLLELVAQTQTTLFLTTHNLAEAERMCTVIGVLRAGRLIALGAPDQLRGAHGQQVILRGSGLATPGVQAALAALAAWSVQAASPHELRLTQPAGSTLAPLLSAVVAQGGRVDSVAQTSASLEDTFLELVRSQEEVVHA